jgi:hypothetical protein
VCENARRDVPGRRSRSVPHAAQASKAP